VINLKGAEYFVVGRGEAFKLILEFDVLGE
jgi:hypothetical protein